MTETLTRRYSFEITQYELSNEFQHDRLSMVIRNLCIRVLWMKVARALIGRVKDVHCFSVVVFSVSGVARSQLRIPCYVMLLLVAFITSFH